MGSLTHVSMSRGLASLSLNLVEIAVLMDMVQSFQLRRGLFDVASR